MTGNRNIIKFKQPIVCKYFAKGGTCPNFSTFFDHGSHGFHTRTNNEHLVGMTWIKTPPQFHCDMLKKVDTDLQENYQRFCPHNPHVHNMKHSHELDDHKPILKPHARNNKLHVLPCSKKRGVEALQQHDEQLHSKIIKLEEKHGLSNSCGEHKDKHCQHERQASPRDNVAMKSAIVIDTKQLLSHDESEKNACKSANLIISTNSIPPNFEYPTSNQQAKKTIPKVSTHECNDDKGTTSTCSTLDVHGETHIKHAQMLYKDNRAIIIEKIKETYVVYKNIQGKVVQAEHYENKWFDILTNLITSLTKDDQQCELLPIDHNTSYFFKNLTSLNIQPLLYESLSRLHHPSTNSMTYNSMTLSMEANNRLMHKDDGVFHNFTSPNMAYFSPSFVNIDNKLKHHGDEAQNVSMHAKSTSPLTTHVDKSECKIGEIVQISIDCEQKNSPPSLVKIKEEAKFKFDEDIIASINSVAISSHLQHPLEMKRGLECNIDKVLEDPTIAKENSTLPCFDEFNNLKDKVCNESMDPKSLHVDKNKCIAREDLVDKSTHPTSISSMLPLNTIGNHVNYKIGEVHDGFMDPKAMSFFPSYVDKSKCKVREVIGISIDHEPKFSTRIPDTIKDQVKCKVDEDIIPSINTIALSSTPTHPVGAKRKKKLVCLKDINNGINNPSIVGQNTPLPSFVEVKRLKNKVNEVFSVSTGPPIEC